MAAGLKRRREFLRVAGRGRKAARPGVLLQALAAAPGPDGLAPGNTAPTGSAPEISASEAKPPVRLGFTATKKLGNAVVRNRAKRRLRAAARLVLADHPGGWDLVLVGREATGSRRFSTLMADLRGAMRQLGVLPPADAIAPAAPVETVSADPAPLPTRAESLA